MSEAPAKPAKPPPKPPKPKATADATADATTGTTADATVDIVIDAEQKLAQEYVAQGTKNVKELLAMDTEDASLARYKASLLLVLWSCLPVLYCTGSLIPPHRRSQPPFLVLLQ
jgi:hypothetical protein